MVRKIMRLFAAGVTSFVFAFPFVAPHTFIPREELEVVKKVETKEKVEDTLKTAKEEAEKTAEVASTPEVPESIQEPAVETPIYEPIQQVVQPTPEPAPPVGSGVYSPSDFMTMGVLNWGGYRWTWYSEKVLPGGGLNIPGRHVDGNGYVCDGDGFICLASNDLPFGTVVDTPLGKAGKVYDCGCASGTLDVYVSW